MILITGTPGTGKTSISKNLSKLIKRNVIHLNKFIKDNALYEKYDKSSKSYIVDTDKLKNIDFGNSIVEGHLSHFIRKNVEITIVLRCSPLELKKRLKKKKWKMNKINENILSEMLDSILIEAEEMHKKIIQIDTSNASAEESAKKILKYIKYGKSDKVSWLEKYKNLLPDIEKTLKKINYNKS